MLLNQLGNQSTWNYLRSAVRGLFFSFLFLLTAAFETNACIDELALAKSGDLLFLALDCGPLACAIQESEQEKFGRKLPMMNHVGFLERDDSDELWFVEAVSGFGVIRSPVEEVLVRPSISEPILARFQEPYRDLAQEALNVARSFEGRAYDKCFRLENEEVYCSELIYRAFEIANDDHAVFGSLPMRFGAEGSDTRRFWESYFRIHGEEVPVGEPGISPHSIWLQGQAMFFVGKIEETTD